MKKIKLSRIRLGKQLIESLGAANARERVRRVTNLEARNIKKHFRTDGWPLDWASLKETVFYDAFGFHLSDILLQELLAARINFVLSSATDGLKLRKAKGRLPKGPLKLKLEITKMRKEQIKAKSKK